MAPQPFDWSDNTPAPELKVHLGVPRREFYYFRDRFDLKAVKETWPCKDTGYTKEDQANLLSDLQRFYKQPNREDGDDVVVIETYRPPKSGFPGRLNSTGAQGLVRAVRSNLLKETADPEHCNAH